MLMDEPFGAIDPINRSRLQNEFLRLQAQVKKTIVFVTHDIDEAIKMGDRIAILQVGGKLAQYAPPAELLLHPANAFVEDFVGGDRALKRLALMRVSDVPPAALGNANGGPEIPVDTPLRTALSELLGQDVLHGRVVDEHGQSIGSLSVDVIAQIAAGKDPA
jgi:osmoprotectant transport system ATP-binding protein